MSLNSYLYKTTKKNYEAIRKLYIESKKIDEEDKVLYAKIDKKYHLTELRKAYETLEYNSAEYKSKQEEYRRIGEDSLKDPEFKSDIESIESRTEDIKKRKESLEESENIDEYDRDCDLHQFINNVFNNGSDDDNCVAIGLPKDKIVELLDKLSIEFNDVFKRYNVVHNELSNKLDEFFNTVPENKKSYEFHDWRIDFLRNIIDEYEKPLKNNPDNDEIMIYYYGWY